MRKSKAFIISAHAQRNFPDSTKDLTIMNKAILRAIRSDKETMIYSSEIELSRKERKAFEKYA